MRKQANKPIYRPKISEADVQQAVVTMLELDGWRSIRTDPVSNRGRGKGFGEPGMPDYLFIRYLYRETGWECLETTSAAATQILWVEFKAAGKKRKLHQTTWHDRERARGALVMTFDSVDAAREWYKTSGLMRNKILT